MKAYGIALLLLILTVCSKQIYQCNSKLPKNVCTRKDTTSQLEWLNPCNDTTLTYCPLKMDGANDDICVAKSAAANLFPGESCTSNTECISQNCIPAGSGKACASTAKLGDPCNVDSECDAKFSCVYAQGAPQGVCTAQLDLNAPNCGLTKYDQKCFTGYVCNLKQCVKPFSLKDGSEADNPMACANFYNHYDSVLQKTLCTTGSFLTYFNSTTVPVKCDQVKNNCSYSLNYSKVIISIGDFPCDFSYNDQDISYCNPGRSRLTTPLNTLIQYLNNSYNTTNKCHISAGFFCNFNNQTSNDFYKAYIAFIKLTQYNQVYNSSDCINKTINSKYTYALTKGGSGFNAYSISSVLSLALLVLLF